MIKLLLPLLLALNLYAFDVQMASKIFDKLFGALIPKNDIAVYVYTKDEEYTEVIELAKNLSLVEDLEYADITLVNNERNIPLSTKLPLFTTNLELYKKAPNAVGIFYWKHGRPKIVFSKEKLQKFQINLAPQWAKYIKSDMELN